MGETEPVSLDKTVELTVVLSRIIDYRSAFTAMHSAGVAASATALARLSGMDEDECKMMRIAGLLHDIGKLKVPRAILEKPGKLTEEEFNIVKEHPYYTRLNMMNLEGFEKIANWAAFHHEKLNGKGYPFHLDASSLDTGARIMAVADIFSAITEVRPCAPGELPVRRHRRISCGAPFRPLRRDRRPPGDGGQKRGQAVLPVAEQAACLRILSISGNLFLYTFDLRFPCKPIEKRAGRVLLFMQRSKRTEIKRRRKNYVG